MRKISSILPAIIFTLLIAPGSSADPSGLTIYGAGGKSYKTLGILPATDETVNPEVLKLLAAQGHPVAQYDLGVYHYKGLGVPNNDQEAARLFRLSSDQGFSRATCNLARCYLLRAGVEENLPEAIRLFQLAKTQGLKEANSCFK